MRCPVDGDASGRDLVSGSGVTVEFTVIGGVFVQFKRPPDYERADASATRREERPWAAIAANRHSAADDAGAAEGATNGSDGATASAGPTSVIH